MLDIELIRKEPDKVREGIKKKGASSELVDAFLEVDEKWRSLVTETESIRAEKKNLGKEDVDKSRKLKEDLKSLEDEVKNLEEKKESIIEQIPNIPAENIKVGKDESENEVIKTVGEKPEFSFTPKDYITLAGDMIDIETASKVAGSRFSYILGDLVLLEFALIKLAYDKLLPHGFIPVIPPVMVRPEVLRDMGKAKFLEGDDAFFLEKDNLFLVGSSEHTIGPLHMNSVINDTELPKRYLGFSTCFRREAGSYGKDAGGILRVHQFDKVEMFSIVKPEDSEREHEFLLEREEELMQALGLHYQVVSICTGDMGFENYRQYDIETWMPGQNKYRETHSASNTTDYQSRGLKIKYRHTEEGQEKKDFVHMLNGTAFAIGRILIAIIENYQEENGDIVVPEVLRSYVGKEKIKKA